MASHQLSSCSNIEQQSIMRRQPYEDRKSSLSKQIIVNKPFEKALEMLNKIEYMKREAIEKLSKSFMSKVIDDRIKVEFQKTFRFLFGKLEGDQAVFRLIMDKKVNIFVE